MTSTEYLRAFARFWWLIVVCVVLGTALAAVVDGMVAPPYTATSRVLVTTSKSSSTNASDAYYATLLAQQRVLSYAELAHSPAVTQTVIDDLDLSTTSSDLESRLRIVVPTNTTVLDISVDDSSSARAQRIAEDAAAVVARLIATQESVRNQASPLLRARTVGDATTPTPSTARRNTLLGAAGGLVAGLLLALVATRIDPRLHDEDAVSQAAGREVLGVLPLGRARSPLMRTPPSREDAIRALRSSLFFRHPGPEQSLTVSITSVEPVAELPDLADELAAALADTGARVLLVEADLHHPRQASLTDLPDDGGAGLATYLDGTRREPDVLRHRSEHGFDVVPAGLTAADPADLLHSQAFTDVVDDAARHYDFVLLVAPALSLGTDALAVAARAELTLVAVVRGRTRGPRLHLALRRLERAGAGDVDPVLVT